MKLLLHYKNCKSFLHFLRKMSIYVQIKELMYFFTFCIELKICRPNIKIYIVIWIMDYFSKSILKFVFHHFKSSPSFILQKHRYNPTRELMPDFILRSIYWRSFTIKWQIFRIMQCVLLNFCEKILFDNDKNIAFIHNS